MGVAAQKDRATITGATSSAFHPEASQVATKDSMLLGRVAELSALHAALAAAKEGGTVVALLRGRSGIGKSTLARSFLDDLTGGAAVVLEGRCFEQGSGPY